MDKKNTRIAVPLTEEAYDAISLISKVSGRSRGRILADAFEAAAPSFIAVASAYKAAMAVEGEEREVILRAMEQAEEKLLAVVAEMDLTGAVQKEERSETAAAPKGGKRAGAGRSDPPITNRGVPNPTNGGQP